MLVFMLGGILVTSALIGIVNTGFRGRLAELRKGRAIAGREVSVPIADT